MRDAAYGAPFDDITLVTIRSRRSRSGQMALQATLELTAELVAQP
jgi:hypothetical protein